MSFLINLINATKIYQTGATQYHALNGVNFSLNRGEMVAIVGTSGSGKSTLMNILGFLDHCTTGKYFFADQDVSRLNDEELSTIRNQKVGFVFQSFFLLPRLNALQNVMLPLFYGNIDTAAAEQKSIEMLDKVGMKSFITHKPNQLSGGQQQRVAIARALVNNPEVIFADEPTGALDSRTSHDVMSLLQSLNENENRTIVIITHDTEITHVCKRIFTLKDGYIVDEILS